MALVTTNQQIEGDDITSFQAVVPTVRVGNYTQISRKTLILAGTQEVVEKAGRKSEKAYQLAKLGKEMKRDMEADLLANKAANAGATGSARVTASMGAWIKTNTDIGATGANPSYTTVPTATRTDGTLRTISEAMLKTVIKLCWDNGASPSTVMVGSGVKQTVSGFSGIATKTIDQSAAKPAVIIGAADVYVSDFGTLRVVPNRFQRSRDAWVLDFDHISVDYLRPFQTIALAKTGDADKTLLLAEYGLRVNYEKGLGLVADVQA